MCTVPQATGSEVPLIIRSCIKAIESNGTYGVCQVSHIQWCVTVKAACLPVLYVLLPIGMKMEGLFRVPGPAAYTEELRKGFEEG